MNRESQGDRTQKHFQAMNGTEILKISQASFPRPYTPYTYATQDTVVGWGGWRVEMPGSYKMPPITKHFKTRQRVPLFSKGVRAGVTFEIWFTVLNSQNNTELNIQDKNRPLFSFIIFKLVSLFFFFFFLRWIPINSIGATAATENVKAPLHLLFALFFFVSFSSGFSFKPLLFFS